MNKFFNEYSSKQLILCQLENEYSYKEHLLVWIVGAKIELKNHKVNIIIKIFKACS